MPPTKCASIKSSFPHLVSVLIPTFNRASTIREAIGSVAAQHYRPVELFVVDDGSTDGTADVVEQCRFQYGNDDGFQLQYIRQNNAGAAAARNHGLRLCHGEYIQFLDSDDLLEPGKLERQVAILREDSQCDVVYGDWLMGADYPSARFLNRSQETDMLAALLRGRWVPCFSYLWRRPAVGLWDEHLAVNDDFDFSVRAAARGARFQYHSRLTGLYRWHASNRLSRQSVCIFAKANFQVLQEVKRLLDERGTLSIDRRRAIADCYWEQCRPCVNIDRELFETGMRELRAVCPKWQPRRGRERLMMRHLGAVQTAQFGQGIASIRSVFRKSIKALLGDQLRVWLIQNHNRFAIGRGVAQ